MATNFMMQLFCVTYFQSGLGRRNKISSSMSKHTPCHSTQVQCCLADCVNNSTTLTFEMLFVSVCRREEPSRLCNALNIRTQLRKPQTLNILKQLASLAHCAHLRSTLEQRSVFSAARDSRTHQVLPSVVAACVRPPLLPC